MYKIVMLLGAEIPQRYLHTYPNVTIYDRLQLSQAVAIARTLVETSAVDAIISPSGTAALIEQHVSVPVIRSDPSRFDMLRTLHYAGSVTKLHNDKIALVVHRSRLIDLNFIQDFLSNEVHLHTYENEPDIRQIVEELARQRFSALVGGPTAVHKAEELGIRGFCFRMTPESLNQAINLANHVLQLAQKSREHGNLLETALNLFADGVLITNNSGEIIKNNSRAAAILKISPEELRTRSVDQIFNDAGCAEVYSRGMQQMDRILELPGGIRLFSSRMPVITDGKVQGAVITFQEVAKIEKLEHKYRQYQSRGLTARYHFKDIICDSACMKLAIEKAKAFALADSTVLIQGETGTGKELFSQSMHNYSPRSKGPFVAVNCAALPGELLESELMGYEEGAFTSARRGGKTGLFELAHMGTIFLDEINHIPLHLQASILRVLQEQQVLRIGGDRMIPINVRVIATTNENLTDLIRAGTFREDLYYRLGVLNLNIPPLRERKEDIARLVRYYFDAFVHKYGHTAPLKQETLALLESYSWPGNIRELINCIERYVVISRHLNVSGAGFVSEFVQSEQRGACKNASRDINLIQVRLGTLSDMERQLIQAVLKRYNGNKLQSAMALGLSRTTLWKKLRNPDLPNQPDA